MSGNGPRFSLRTLLIAVVLCAVAAWGVRMYRRSKMYRMAPQVQVTKWEIVGSDSQGTKRKQIEYLYRIELGRAERYIDCEPFGSVDEVTVSTHGRFTRYFSSVQPHVESVGTRQITTAMRNRFEMIQSIAEERCNFDHMVWQCNVATGWNPSPILRTEQTFFLTPADLREINGAAAKVRPKGNSGK